MRFVDLIEKKKQKQPLTKEELHFFITGYAVSYTHLDVYKRQDIRIPIRSRFVFAYISKRACTILSGCMAAVGC